MTTDTELMPPEIQPIDMMRQGEFSWGRVTECGIEVVESIEEETWAEVVNAILAAYDISKCGHVAMLFRVGDIYNSGTDKFGDRAYQLVNDQFEHILSKRQIGRCMWVARQIPAELRRLHTLTWEHHEKTAACSLDEIKTLLEKAEKEKLTTAELRDEVKLLHPPEPKPKDKKKPAKADAPKVTEEDAIAAAETLANYFDQAEEADGGVSTWALSRLKKSNGFLHPLEMIAKRVRNAITKHKKNAKKAE